MMSVFTGQSDVSTPIIKVDVPSSSNQDRGNQWTVDSSHGEITILMVADGHGFNGTSFSEFAVTWVENLISTQDIDWEADDLTQPLHDMILSLETTMKDKHESKSGGTTLSLFIRRGSLDNWVVNLGDSEIVMFDKSSKNHVILSEDHSPGNMNEFLRMISTHPDTVFEYDKVVKRGPFIPIYEQTDDRWVKISTPQNNRYYKNVESDFATYFGDGSDYKLSTTRSIGDFHYKEYFGASAEPYIKKLEPLTENQVVFIASDGFWDCWKYSEVTEFLQNKSLEELEKEHVEKSDRYFGSSKDDTFLYII
jgi:serine/threonine protein phosphatase PrpC